MFTGTDVKILSGSLLKTTLGTKYRADRVWIVIFHSKQLSRKFAEDFAGVAKTYVDVVHFASVDCDNKDCTAFCEYSKVTRVSSGAVLKLYSSQKVEDITANVKLTGRLQGLSNRKARQMIKLALARLPEQHIHVLQQEDNMELSQTVLQFVKRCIKSKPSKKACVVLVSEKEQPSSLFKAISSRHKLKLSFAFLHLRRASKRAAMKSLHIKTTPSLLVYKVDASTKIGKCGIAASSPCIELHSSVLFPRNIPRLLEASSIKDH